MQRGDLPERSDASVPSEARASKRNFSFSCADNNNTRGAAPSNEKFLSPSEARRNEKFLRMNEVNSKGISTEVLSAYVRIEIPTGPGFSKMRQITTFCGWKKRL